MSWLNSVLEIGNAIIDYREAEAAIHSPEGRKHSFATRKAWAAIFTLIERPTMEQQHASATALTVGIAASEAAINDKTVSMYDQRRFLAIQRALNRARHSINDPHTAIGSIKETANTPPALL
ncbi:hypothetical protein [Burkholderia multivorans]|uniref:hypothetical protein n=1 Tax=Burkholderia multivorans TaxID=87883 RepID=UPI0021C1BACB|nr:hypothetical protein [Burkholderia multivorans]